MPWRDLRPDDSEGWDREAHRHFIEVRNRAADEFEALPRDVHERLVLEAIVRSPHPATRTEITTAIAGRLPEFYVDSDVVHGVLKRLLSAGEVDREEGQWGPCRYRWFRRTPDDLADLERALEAVA